MNAHSSRRARLQTVVHACTAFVLLLKGFSKLDHPEGYGVVIAVSLTGGMLVLLGTLLHRKLEGRFRHFDAVVEGTESLACAAVGTASLHHGSATIHYAWFVAATGFAIATIVRIVTARRAAAATSEKHEPTPTAA